MRRVGFILNLLATALLIAVVALWLRSHRVADVLMWQQWRADAGGTYRATFRTLTSGRGVVGIDLTALTTAFPATSDAKPRFTWARADASQFRLPEETFWNRVGFGYVSETQSTQGLKDSTVTTRAYWLPHWLLAGAASLVPLRWAIALVTRARRRRRGLCARCGYDVRVSQGRCPECGEPLPVRSDGPASTGASAH
jgi:hypothetical protein